MKKKKVPKLEIGIKEEEAGEGDGDIVQNEKEEIGGGIADHPARERERRKGVFPEPAFEAKEKIQVTSCCAGPPFGFFSFWQFFAPPISADKGK